MSIFYGELENNKEQKPKITFVAAFKAILPLGALIHTIFLIAFYRKGVTLLFYYNILSVLLYIYVSFWGMKKHFFSSTIIVFFEILIHSILCCLLIGWTGGFYVYPLCLLPITYFVSMNIAKNYVYGHLAAIIILLNYQFWNVFSQHTTAPYEHLIIESRDIFYNFNTICASIILVTLLFSFLYEMRYIQDMLENKNKILNNLANFDMLTEIKNRRSMLEEIKAEVEKFNKSKLGFFIAIADIDNFKNFNDTYGHDCGDLILKEVANILKRNSEEFSIDVSRWGGEEFLILIKYNELEMAESVCQKISDDIRNYKLNYNETDISITITIGVSYFGKDYKDIDEVLKNADRNLYIGKTTTKNCIIIK